jgi:hypothetical protein
MAIPEASGALHRPANLRGVYAACGVISQRLLFYAISRILKIAEPYCMKYSYLRAE